MKIKSPIIAIQRFQAEFVFSFKLFTTPFKNLLTYRAL